MKPSLFLLSSCGLYAVSQGLLINPAMSQIVRDGTTSTIVEVNGDNIVINNGDRAGANLFHSFEQFSVPSNSTASFNNATDISNIFSRITGGRVSNLDGAIRANGNANLFLINPAGIIFGNNATLDIGGSFYGSTADSILFPDGEFSAIAPDNRPILIIDAPIGLNLRNNPAGVTVNSDLELATGESFNLIGGEINFNFGTVSIPQGSINVISLAQLGTIEIDDNNSFTIPQNLNLNNINLNNFGLQIIATEENSGNLNLTGNSISLINGSRLTNTSEGIGNAGNITINALDAVEINTDAGIFSNTFAQGDAGAIHIKAVNNITLTGTNTGRLTGIFSGADLDEDVGTPENLTGSAGEIRLETNNLFLDNDAMVSSNSFGGGDAGDIFIDTQSVNLTNNSGIFSGVGTNSNLGNQATANGGLIDINTQNLSLSNGSLIVTQSFGQGNAGTINIDANESINISGTARFPFLYPESELAVENNELGGFSSGLFSNSEESALGNGGNIFVTTPRLAMSDGAVITARSRGSGNAGNLSINANILEIKSGSQILAPAFDSGSAGNINLNVTEQILISGIDTSYQNRFDTVRNTFGENQALSTIDPVSEVSGIFANTSSESTGEGGNIAVGIFSGTEDTLSLDNTQFTSEIIIRDRGVIAADSQGSGNSGSISLHAAELTLDDQAKILASTNVLPENQIDNGVNINLKIDDSLTLQEDSLISAQALQANGGNINIDAANGFVVAFPSQNEGNDIVANAAQTGGNITINSQAVLGLEEAMAFGQSGTRLNNQNNDFDVTGSVDGVVEIITPDVNTIQGMPELSSNPITSDLTIERVCSANAQTNTNNTSLIVKGKGGIPLRPTEPLSSHQISIDRETASLSTANPNTDESAKSVSTSIGEIIPARGVKISADGSVALVSYSTNTVQPQQNTLVNCSKQSTPKVIF